MNTMHMHRITGIKLDPVSEEKLDNGSEYTRRHLTIYYKDFHNNQQEFTISLFGEKIRDIVIRDETLAELDEAASEEAAYYAELEAGYKQDRM